MWHYADWTDGLDDALRLSRAMTLKCSLAGLTLGGGKSVIALPVDVRARTRSVDETCCSTSAMPSSRCGGVYGAGKTSARRRTTWPRSMNGTRFVYGLPEASGGSGEPSAPTAVGVYESILVTCQELFGTRDLAGRAITIVGLGQVGSRLANHLLRPVRS